MTEKTRKPARKKRWLETIYKDMEPIDYVLSVIGLCLGTAAALFPWHVYLNPDSYGPPRMAFSRDGIIPEAEIQAQQSGAPLHEPETGPVVADGRKPDVDMVTTGEINRDATSGLGDPKQAFPSNGARFEVLVVDGTRALVGDSDGVYLVRPQSRLPDGTLAMSFKQDEEGWYILTSEEKILRPR